jgi:hypothetical protein
MDHGAAEADAEIDVVEFAEGAAGAIELLAVGGGRKVDLEERRQAGDGGERLADGDALPALERRRPDEAH